MSDAFSFSGPDGEDSDAMKQPSVVGETTIPCHFGASQSVELLQKLHVLLWSTPGQLGSVYRAMAKLPDAGPSELLAHTTCANSGAVGNRRAVVNAVINDVQPRAQSVASQAAGSVRTLLKSTNDKQVSEWLNAVLFQLEQKAGSEEAVAEEVKELEENSSELAETLHSASGVYVYTYPHYWRHPYIPGTQRRLLKVGRTNNTAWSRILTQARQTGMPEDPLLLRVYKTPSVEEAEKSFHHLLDAAEHERSFGAAVGKEWFSTTLEYCDAIASVLKLEIVKGSKSDEQI
ncbi:GIY-YIG nuclease family protein [Actinomycetospora soli]|uniref:GIY-YIG nuclease family protein n=1 Tax=Actinomycetospora soli TaxID=2893887 RepID=UPI001E32785D|nr:GIY-YIG nuclease family protein [Actinomycetospora soli]MCD2186621.1 GIY-YIG nuclease family protein [Actinomycetospora soli]